MLRFWAAPDEKIPIAVVEGHAVPERNARVTIGKRVFAVQYVTYEIGKEGKYIVDIHLRLIFA